MQKHRFSLLILLFSALVLILNFGFSVAQTLPQQDKAKKEETTQVKPDVKEELASEKPLDIQEQTVEKQQQTQTPKTKTNNKNNDDRFIPTEEISEDLAVSFPIDI